MILRRFLTAFGETEESPPQPGLIQKNDGTVWLVNPDGSEVQVAGGGSQTVLSATTLISSAQLLNNLTGGIAVTPVVPAGKMIVPLQVAFTLLFGGTPYILGADVKLHVSTIEEYINQPNGGEWGETIRDSLLSLGLNTTTLMIPVDDVSLAGVDGQALAIFCNEAVTGGNGRLSVTSAYTIADVPT